MLILAATLKVHLVGVNMPPPPLFFELSILAGPSSADELILDGKPGLFAANSDVSVVFA